MATTKKTSTNKRSTSSGSASKRTSTARKSAEKTPDAASNGGRSRGAAPRASARKKKSGIAVAAEAARQLLELTGREVEGVTGLERSEDGWTIQVEVVEMRRIPDTTDVLALYELDVDEDGDLDGYRRLRRYVRGTPGED